MSIFYRIRIWLRSFLRPETVERELEMEFQHHLELEIEKNVREGMSLKEARRKAVIDFGGVERFKEQTVSAHVTFTKGERSRLSELAANLL